MSAVIMKKTTTTRMITQIFHSRYPIKMPVKVTTSTWQNISSTLSCLITGMQNGRVGITWYPTPLIMSNPHSLTLSLNLSAITHIRCSSKHTLAAIADRNGMLMLLHIKPPPEVNTRPLATISNPQKMTVGLNWSNDGKRLACLSASPQRGHPLTLFVYSNLTQSQITLAKVPYPRHLVGQGLMNWELDTPSQRLAWSHDDTSIFITVPYHLLIEVSTHTWTITSKHILFYSTQISLLAPRQFLAIDTNRCLSLYHTSFTEAKELKYGVENCTTFPEQGLLLVVVNRAQEGRRLYVLSLKHSHRVIGYKLPTKHRVTSLSLSPDMSVLVYTTTAEVGSLVLYRSIPTLSQLCMSQLREHEVDMTHLPKLLRERASIQHTVLCYPGEFSEELDLCVYKLEKKWVFGRRRTLVVQKHHLGYNLEVFRLSQSMRRKMRLAPQRESGKKGKRMLDTLLDSTLATPPADTKIKWNSAMTRFSIRSDGSKIQLRVGKGMSVTIQQEQHDMIVNHKDGAVELFLCGEELALITEERNFFRIRLYRIGIISYLQSLLIVLAFILSNKYFL